MSLFHHYASPLSIRTCHLSQLCLSELFYYHFCDYYISVILNVCAASFHVFKYNP